MDIQLLKNSLKSIVDSLDRIDGEREHIKEVAKIFEEKTDIHPKHLKKAARLIQKSKAVDHREENEVLDQILCAVLIDQPVT